jgi:hypothetical protein
MDNLNIPIISIQDLGNITPVEGMVVFCLDCDAEVLNVNNIYGTFYIYQNGYWQSFKPCNTANPLPSTHTTSTSRITWNWLPVVGAKGYRFGNINDYNSSIDMGSLTSKFEKDLTPGTIYNRYVWAYKDCGHSQAVLLTQSTLAPFIPGSSITIDHNVSRGVAPVNKTITYNTIVVPWTLASPDAAPTLVWTTKNLGATRVATSATDKTAESAGWYFQFNNKQGFKATIDLSGVTHRTPDKPWNGVQYSEYSNWKEENDPCFIELGIGWRIPTKQEWEQVDNFGTGLPAFNSMLKFHYGGWLYQSDGHLNQQSGLYWSSNQANNSTAFNIVNMSGTFTLSFREKNNGACIRCVRDLNK